MTNLIDKRIDFLKNKLKESEVFFEETDCVETMHRIDQIRFAIEQFLYLSQEVEQSKE